MQFLFKPNFGFKRGKPMKQNNFNFFTVLALISIVCTVPLFAGGAGDKQSGGASKTAAVSGGKPKIEVFFSPWVYTPIEEPDPYKKYIDELTGAEWSLTYATDFTTELTTRASADMMPDLILFDDNRLFFNFYDQGVLLDDWSPYQSRMPQAFKNMGETAKTYFTVDGKLTACATVPGDQAWALNIRQDWLNKLGLKMPTTPDELFEVARAFTFNDPDGNGKNDTYGFTAAGNGQGFNELINLCLMYGPIGFYVENNKVNHPILDGNLKKTLDYVKKIIDAKVINPDWFTIGFEDRKPNLFNGQYGIAWYPYEALVGEIESVRKDKLAWKWFTYLPMPKAGPAGGKLNPGSPIGSPRTVSYAAGGNKAKMDGIIKFMETCAPPHKEYLYVRRGAIIDHSQLVELPQFPGRYVSDELKALADGKRLGDGEGQNLGLANYGKIVNSYNPQDDFISLDNYEITPEIEIEEKTTATVARAPRNQDYAFLLKLNSDNNLNAGLAYNEFIVKYVLGQDMDYDAFVKRWLSIGGQALINEATSQFKSYGIIK
jgi:putative aldouronate transport system substrate-binding protein